MAGTGDWRPEWPYDWTSTEFRLDPQEIERQGSFLLSRALNLGKLVAFLGTGVSIPYGRVSWTELATIQIKTICAALAVWDKARQARYGDLIQELTKLDAKDPEDFDADTNMLALQLCEQFWNLTEDDELFELAKTFGIGDRYLKLRDPKPANFGRVLMRAWIAKETHDELPHVAKLLSGELPENANLKGLDKLPIARENLAGDDFFDTFALHWSKAIGEFKQPRPLARVNAGHTRRLYAEIFTKETITSLRQSIKTGSSPLATLAASLLDTLVRHPLGNIAPSHYYILAAVFDIIRVHNKTQGIGQAPVAALTPTSLKTRDRRSIIPEALDPLCKLVQNLDIRRYLTTNYDLEFERFLSDIGFEIPSAPLAEQRPSSQETTGPLGALARDSVLDATTAVDLVNFAVQERDLAYQLIHLHGRATDEAEIVVTERDYQLKYVRDTEVRQLYTEGLELTFGGNPMLFVGLGMGEGDILRPLREFAAGVSRRNQSLIALRPASEDTAKCDQFTRQQYSRYGVHIVHYGFVVEHDKKRSWLMPLIDSKTGSVATLRKIVKSPDLKITEIETWITNFIDALQGIAVFDKSKLTACSTFEADGGPCNIRVDVEALLAICNYREQLLRSGIPFDDDSKLICGKALDRAAASLRTSALCAKLDGMSADWKKWWNRWREDLSTRDTHAVYPEYPPQSACYHRHLQFPLDAIIGSSTDVRRADPHVDAILGAIGSKLTKKTGRRIFFVTGTRGSGKGHCFATLRQDWQSLKDNGNYKALLFITLSFSSEAASVWDRLILFLNDCDKFNEPTTTRATPDRVAHLKSALATASRRSRRLLVVFNAFDVLFEKGGAAKTEEIRQLVECLIGDEGKNASLDLVLLTRTSRIPYMYRTNVTENGAKKLRAFAAIRKNGNAVSPSSEDLKNLEKHQVRVAPAKQNDESFVVLPAPPKNEFDNLCSLNVWPGFEKWIAEQRQIVSSGAVVWSKVEDKLSRLLRRIKQKYHGGLLIAILNVICRQNAGDLQRTWSLIEKTVDEFSHYAAPRGGQVDDYQRSEALLERIFDFWYAQASNSLEADLSEAVLRHVAMIGIPIEANILASCPEIKTRLARLEEKPSDAENRIGGKLKEWESRGLVFSIAARATNPSASTPRHRWAVHRTVQHYIYRRLGAQRIEPADSLSFSPSVFALDTRDQIQLSANSYAFVYDLVDSLSAFPTLKNNLPRILGDGDEDKKVADIDLYFGKLRATIGIVKSLFSIGVVSRFADIEGLGIPLPPQLGFFEHHRKILRWMIRFAGTLGQELVASKRGEKLKQRIHNEVWPPFYSDEIVWLYNECGVFSLAQGEINDAHALLGQAASINKRLVEGGDDLSPMALRIRLNLAICSIERGRLDAAEFHLGAVRTSCRDKPLCDVARGYSAIVCGIRGDVHGAMELYAGSIASLENLKMHRPVSILRRCKGDLLRHLGNYRDAEKEYEAAIVAAASGGNVDLAHQAEVAAARLNAILHKDDDRSRKALEKALSYADLMELPRLKAEAQFVKSEILLASGETTLAAQFATSALRIATLHGLALRKIAYAELLARIYAARGDIEASETLLSKTLKSARERGYGLLADRIYSTRKTQSSP